MVGYFLYVHNRVAERKEKKETKKAKKTKEITSEWYSDHEQSQCHARTKKERLPAKKTKNSWHRNHRQSQRHANRQTAALSVHFTCRNFQTCMVGYTR